MDARIELDALDAEVRSGANTVEGYVQSVATLGTDIPAAVAAAERFMFLTRSQKLYAELTSESEDEASLSKVVEEFAAALNHG